MVSNTSYKSKTYKSKLKKDTLLRKAIIFRLRLINEQESNEKWTDKVLSDDSGGTTFEEFNFKNYQDYSNVLYK